ncbi:MAG: hypothetical protein M3020_24210, partial [Myxococcota bacterium]|nr:hypothetical protein [Myxococcota bacterium]
MTKPITVPHAAPTAAQLRERRPGLIETITAAENAIAAARTEQEAAFKAFTAEETEDTAKALWLAEQRVRARERRHVELTADLEAHDAATSVTERRELEQRLEDIGAELADNRRANELDAAATKAAVKLVDALLE